MTFWITKCTPKHHPWRWGLMCLKPLKSDACAEHPNPTYFVELVVHGCEPIGSTSWMPSCLRPTVVSIKPWLPDTQLHSWHCHVRWIQSGLCCAYSRLVSQELDVNPNFMFRDTTQTHSKTLDSDGVSTSCYLWWNASKARHLVWVKQMYGICFFHVAQMSIATLLENHFLEAKVSVDSHAQDTIRTHNISSAVAVEHICLFMLTHLKMRTHHPMWQVNHFVRSTKCDKLSENLWDDYSLSGYMMYHCTCPNIQVQFVWLIKVE